MLKELKEYLKPKSVEEAWSLFRDPAKNPSLFLTGGLSVAQREDQTTKTLIDLSGLLGDSVSETATDYILDGNVKIADCIEKIDMPFLKEALHSVGSRQIRNMSTIAGTLGQRYSWSDTITALLALDAIVEGYNGSTVTMSLDQYLKNRAPLLVTKVMIPKRYDRGAFFKFSKISYDIATLNLAIVFKSKKKRTHSKRPLSKGVGSSAVRAPESRFYCLERALPFRERPFHPFAGICCRSKASPQSSPMFLRAQMFQPSTANSWCAPSWSAGSAG